MTTADLYMQAVRRGDDQAAAMFRRELEAQDYGAPYTREAIRDLTEVWSLTADEHNQRLREGLERQLVALDLRRGASAPLAELA